jgi:hypothetical protein
MGKVFYMTNHQGKSNKLAQALIDAGWTRSGTPVHPSVKVALFDHDVGPGGIGYRPPLNELKRIGTPVMMFPHAARPNLQWDGMYPIWPGTKVMFTSTETHGEVMARYGYPIPTEPIGWIFCDMKPFQKPEIEGKIKVLFAPIHPNNNGFLHPIDKAINASVYSTLIMTPGIKVKVRHVKRAELNGLWHVHGVSWKPGNTDIADCLADIDAADVVVAHQTLAYMAVARGKPLIMFGDQMVPRSGNDMKNMRFAKNYDKYRDLMKYPAEAENARNGPEMLKLIQRVIGKDVGKSWRKRMVGEPFDAGRFVELVEKYSS